MPLLGMILALVAERAVEAPAVQVRARDRLLAITTATPGIPVGELAKRMSIRTGTLHYHLERLEAADLIKTTCQGRRRLVFPAGRAFEEVRAAAISLLCGQTALSIAHIVAKQPGISLLGVMAASRETPRTVYYHLKRLKHAGLIASAAPTRYRDLRPTPLLLATLASRPGNLQP